jgi:hypothetical protein
VMVCAWCSTLISRGRPRPECERNYGMCRSCVAEQLARLAPLTPRRSTRLRRARIASPAPARFSSAASSPPSG